MSAENLRTGIEGLILIVIAYMTYQSQRSDKQMDKRDEFLAKIANMIWGDGGEKKGLHTRVEVLENNFDRCGTCNGEHTVQRSGQDRRKG